MFFLVIDDKIEQMSAFRAFPPQRTSWRRKSRKQRSRRNEMYVHKLAERPEVGGGQNIEEFLTSDEIEHMRDFSDFSSSEKKSVKISTQAKKLETFPLAKITEKKGVLFHAREKVGEEFHANYEIEDIFRRKNNRHLERVTFPRML